MKIKLLKYLDLLLGRLLVFFLPSPVKKEVGSPRSVLLIRPGGIGDAVLLLPAIRTLKSAFPDASIDILAEKRNSQIFQLCPFVDHLFRYDRLAEFRQVANRRYDLVIDGEQWHRLSAVVVRLIRGAQKIGFATNERGRMFTDEVDYSHADYETESFARLLAPLGCEAQVDLSLPFLQIPHSVKSAAELLPEVSEPYVALFPGASIEERKWGARRFAELAQRFIAGGCGVVIVGGREDIGVSEEIVLNAPKVVSLAGRTSLLGTAAILKDAALLISGDSGVLHIAVGLNVPTVSLFGPGIAKKWAPRGKKHRVVNLELPCSPCTRFGTTPPCPIGAKCIQDISVDRVFQEAMELLSALSEAPNLTTLTLRPKV